MVEPDLSGSIGPGGYIPALERALDAPLGEGDGTGPIEALVRSGRVRSVAIVVDDPSRWTPVRRRLPVVLGRLHAAGLRTEDVSISVGVGRHHAVDERVDAPSRGRRGGGRGRTAASARRWTTSRRMTTWA